MKHTIIYHSTAEPPKGESTPVNTSGTLDDAIETATHDLKNDKAWADAIEILDAEGELVFYGTRDDLLHEEST